MVIIADEPLPGPCPPLSFCFFIYKPGMDWCEGQEASVPSSRVNTEEEACGCIVGVLVEMEMKGGEESAGSVLGR